MIHWASYLVVLATAMLACVVVPTAYVVWIRLVGLTPTVARRVADLSRPARVLIALVLGFLLGAALQFVPSLPAGIALVTLAATSVFAGLLLFEFVSHRRHRRNRGSLAATESQHPPPQNEDVP